jgi:hypothetical protein
MAAANRSVAGDRAGEGRLDRAASYPARAGVSVVAGGVKMSRLEPKRGRRYGIIREPMYEAWLTPMVILRLERLRSSAGEGEPLGDQRPPERSCYAMESGSSD